MNKELAYRKIIILHIRKLRNLWKCLENVRLKGQNKVQNMWNETA